MKRHNRFREYESHWPQIDLLTACFAIFAFFALIALPQINPKATKDVSKPNAEYIIRLKWQDDMNVDLDLWLEAPDGSVIYYRNKETGLINLDRDSVGFKSNEMTLQDGSVVKSPNEEIISIRGKVPGEFKVAVVLYAVHSTKEMDEGKTPTMMLSDGDHYKVPYTVEVIKINPQVTTVFREDKTIETVKDAKNSAHFELDKDGNYHILPIQEHCFVFDQAGYVQPVTSGVQ